MLSLICQMARWMTERIGCGKSHFRQLNGLMPNAVMVDSVDDLPTTIRPVKP